MFRLHRYAQLLNQRSTRVPLGMTSLDALAIGMVSLSVLLMVQQSTGQFSMAGWVAGAFMLGNGVSAGVQGRLIDRYGPSRVLAPSSIGCAVFLVSLVALTEAAAPGAVLVAAAGLGGLFFPQVVTAMRGLLGQQVEPHQRESAYSLLSIVFEVGVITGPLVVSATLVIASPAAAVTISALLAATAGVVFAASKAARRFRTSHGGATTLGALGSPGVRTLALVSVAFGIGVAAARVGAPALAVESGSAGMSGLLLATLSFGSLLGGLVYGSRSWRLSRVRRLKVLQGAFVLMLLVAALATDLTMLAVVLLVTGLLLAPIVITVSSLIDDVLPHGMVAEAFGVTIMANIAGDAVGTAAAGTIADRYGPAGAFVFGSVAMAVGVLTGHVRRRHLAPAATATTT